MDTERKKKKFHSRRSEVARKMGFERMTLKGFCEREGISTKRGK